MIGVSNAVVFWGVGLGDLIVGSNNGFGSVARIPDEDDISARFQNPTKLRLGFVVIEPVERLGGGDDVDGMVGEGSRFGRGVDAVTMRIAI